MRTYYNTGEWGARLPPPGVREARFAEQFTIPTLQAITFGVGVGLVFGAACWLLWYPSAIVPVSLLAGSATFVAAFSRLLELRQESAPEPEPTARVTLVNARTPSETTAQAQAARQVPERLQRFILDCEGGTERDRLMRLGYTKREIATFRALLMRAECARWKTPDPRGGWELTAPAAAILNNNIR